MANKLKIFPIAIAVVIFDQIAKFVIDGNIILGQKIELIPDILSFTKAYNTGAAFGILEGNLFLLSIVSFLVAIIISIHFIKKVRTIHSKLVFAWALVLGGTVGNLVDRVLFGYVVDFIQLDFINFPIFNLADLSINMGALLIIIHTFTKPD